MKKIFYILKMSFEAILKNKVRSFLSILGIAIGIGSVIALQGLGNGAQNSIQRNVDELGSNTITLSSQSSSTLLPSIPDPSNPSESFDNDVTSVPISKSEYSYLSSELKKIDNNIDQIAGLINDTATVETIEGQVINVPLNAVSENYFSLNNLELAIGNNTLSNLDHKIIIGNSLAEKLKEKRELPSVQLLIGEGLKVNNKRYEIIGILEETKSILLLNNNSSIFISSENYFAENPNKIYYSSVIFSIFDIKDLSKTSKLIEDNFKNYRNLSDDEDANFIISSTEDLASTITQITDIISLLLSGISGISLLVGGIGISNIMLVSVTERTREIGLRKAIGAKRSYILLQFLIEAVLLTLLGGIIGIFLGYALAIGVGSTIGFEASIKLENILLATSISSFIGIFFGFVPAYNASKLSPVDALRYE